MTKGSSSKTTFSRFDAEDLILRDELAIERTLLANERTLMAYLRSAVALIIAGFTIMHFTTQESWFWMLGVICIPSGVSTGIFGIMRFLRMNRMISRIRDQTNIEEPEKEQN